MTPDPNHYRVAERSEPRGASKCPGTIRKPLWTEFGYVPTLGKGPLGWLRWSFLYLFGPPTFLRRFQWPLVRASLALHGEATVLDVGAADLQQSVSILRAGAKKIIAVDYVAWSDDATLIAAECSDFLLLRGDGAALPLRDDCVDRAILGSVVQMVNDPMIILRELARVLRPRGIAVITVPSPYAYVHKAVSRWPRVFRHNGEGDAAAFVARWFGAKGRGFLEREQFGALLEEAGFDLITLSQSPDRLAMLWWEACVTLSMLIRRRWPLTGAFLLFPIAAFRRGRQGVTKGGEWVGVVRVRPGNGVE